MYQDQAMNEADPTPRKFAFKARSFDQANLPSQPPAPSVHEILRHNLAVQKSAEPEILPHLHDRRTKRRRDYWITMLCGNALGGLAAVILPANVVVLVFLLAFFVIFNLSLAWILFHVMDKY
jgi:hypothetical protein